MTEAQLRHIESHQKEFDELMGEPRDVREYFKEYAAQAIIYEDVCEDLNLISSRRNCHTVSVFTEGVSSPIVRGDLFMYLESARGLAARVAKTDDDLYVIQDNQATILEVGLVRDILLIEDAGRM